MYSGKAVIIILWQAYFKLGFDKFMLKDIIKVYLLKQLCYFYRLSILKTIFTDLSQKQYPMAFYYYYS